MLSTSLHRSASTWSKSPSHPNKVTAPASYWCATVLVHDLFSKQPSEHLNMKNHKTPVPPRAFHSLQKNTYLEQQGPAKSSDFISCLSSLLFTMFQPHWSTFFPLEHVKVIPTTDLHCNSFLCLSSQVAIRILPL